MKLDILRWMEKESSIGQRWSVMRDALDERQRRLLAAAEAKALGRDGISAVCGATGVSRSTIMVGLGEIEAMQSRDDTAPHTELRVATGVRRSGGGRKKIETKDATLLPDLLSLVDSRRVETRSHRCAGRARVCAIWPMNSRQEATKSVTSWSANSCGSRTTVCKPTSRCWREAKVLTATPSSSTSTSRLLRP